MPKRTWALITLALAILCLPTMAPSAPLALQKAETYTGEEQVTGWFMSEKLDGIRGYWTGTTLVTRKGKPIHAPEWFIQSFPPFELDGELWSKRNDFAFVQSTVMDQTPSDDWKHITYNIFEVPNTPGDFPTRLDKAKTWFSTHPGSPARIIPQITCEGRSHLDRFMAVVENSGGEGLIVKDPSLPFHTGRSPHVLKVKHAADMEGVVVDINEGKGKYKGMMGSLRLKLENGVEFNLGTGFSDETRKEPPVMGSVVTFKHHGFTRTGKPRFASYLRIRKD
ncbi:ATP-dependent DNA ligase [Desulfoluna limicola]|uniref:ATP-dependent DNA ligase n=1 Tax=Desulfoluna limicola TaxID=2810562 RepID=A0ABM7PG34_9BACT|nr:DNA ligase [Desulfoluna limicola]BCS96563.1 ATP-dependent DNA ligase [Desulfoluna limicola]